jgi:uncharacterized coiled-coil protein SlyX
MIRFTHSDRTDYLQPPALLVAGARNVIRDIAEIGNDMDDDEEMRVIRIGELAEIGEYQEVWWQASGTTMFIPCKDGRLIPGLCRLFIAANTGGVKWQKLTDKTLEVDCSAFHHAQRRKGASGNVGGWLRIDPVLREFGISKDGAIRDHEWADPIFMRRLYDAMADGRFLAAIARLNNITYGQAFRQKITHAYGSRVDRAQDPNITSTPQRIKIQRNHEGHVNHWLEAFAEADRLLAEPAIVAYNPMVDSPVQDIDVLEELSKQAMEARAEADKMKARLAELEALLQEKNESPAKRGRKVANNPPPVAGA